MSFILDALKKAESERQRQSGPTLLELRVTAPRRRWPVWSVLIGILLVANIIVVLGTALRPRQPPETLAAASPAVTATAAASAPAAPASVAVVRTVLTTVPAAAPAPVSPAGDGAAGGTANTSAAFASGRGKEPAEDTEDAELPAARAPGSNPADDEPAVAPPGRLGRAPAATAPSRTELDLPSLSELGGTVPALRLDLHVYADRPADRYALINMHKAREGDLLPEGVRVVAIDRDGVELSYGGTQFMLRPQ
jgi:general secretion pathway protein B